MGVEQAAPSRDSIETAGHERAADHEHPEGDDCQPGPIDRDERAGGGRTEQHARALDPATGHVGRGELARRAHESRHERGLSGAGERHRRGGQGRPRVADRRRAAEEEHDPGAQQRQRLQPVARGQRDLATAAVGQLGGGRREQRRGPQLQGSDGRGHSRPPVLVGEHEHGHPHAELSGAKPQEGQLDAAQARIAQHAPDHLQPSAHPPCPSPSLPRGDRPRAVVTPTRQSTPDPRRGVIRGSAR